MKKLPGDLRLDEAAIEDRARRRRELQRMKSSDEIGGAAVFGGDLTIDGTFGVGCVCIVLGDRAKTKR